MSWPGERQRHSMSSRGVSSVLNTYRQQRRRIEVQKVRKYFKTPPKDWHTFKQNLQHLNIEDDELKNVYLHIHWSALREVYNKYPHANRDWKSAKNLLSYKNIDGDYPKQFLHIRWTDLEESFNRWEVIK